MPTYVVTVEVKSVKGKCHSNMKVGDKIEFIGNTMKGRICPAALHSIYPVVVGFSYGATFPWAKGPTTYIGGCPDLTGQVVFEIKRGKEFIMQVDK